MKKLLAASILALALPLFASAATIAELQAQLQILTTQIAALTAQQGSVLGTTTMCPNLYRNLQRGALGNDVRELQRFLISQGHLAAGNNTGYFGSMTENAVKQFQCNHVRTCSGSPSTTGYGVVGPRTRSAIAFLCGSPSALPVVEALTPRPPPTPTPVPAPPPVIPVPVPTPAPIPNPTPQTGWVPSWISSLNLRSPTAWTNINQFACNAVSFGTTPALGPLFIGRTLNNTDPNNPCSGTNWSLVFVTMNWGSGVFAVGQKLLDTTQGPIVLGDGSEIDTAYDVTVANWNGELWTAFECYGQKNFNGYDAASACVGPLRKDLSLDTSRTKVVVAGTANNPNSPDILSASVPKLLVHQGRLYLYWTMVRVPKATPLAWTNITSRGIEVGLSGASGEGTIGAFISGVASTGAISADAQQSVEVLGLGSDDLTNRVADLFQVVSDGTIIYFTAGRGGGACINPGSQSPGCYRLTIGKANSPLTYHGFHEQIIPDQYLPFNAQEYYRFAYRPTDGKTILMGGWFQNPQNDPNLVTAMKLVAWPENILPPESLPAGYAPVPAPVTTVQMGRDSFANFLYRCVLGRMAEKGGFDNMRGNTSGSIGTFISNFFTSSEYLSKQTANATYVEQMYRCVLHRAPDGGGLQTWTSALTGGMSRADVLSNFLNSAEFKNDAGPSWQVRTGFGL